MSIVAVINKTFLCVLNVQELLLHMACFKEAVPLTDGNSFFHRGFWVIMLKKIAFFSGQGGKSKLAAVLSDL